MQGIEVAQRWRELEAAIDAELQAVGDDLSRIGQDAATNTHEVTAAGIALASIFLPALAAEALAEAERRTGFRGFSRFDPIKAMGREREKLAAELVTIRANPDYVRRAFLVGPVGELTRKLEEARELLAPWEAEAAKFESLEGFGELVAIQYDTPGFALRWWDPKYWRIWAMGDRICEALGLADFGDDVLPAWERAVGPRDQWRARVRTVVDEIAALHGLVQRHDQAEDRLARLEQIYLDEARAALGQHLQTADAELLISWNEGDRGVLTGVRHLAGCVARGRYLEEMMTALRMQRSNLAIDRNKALAKAAKMSQPKRAYTTQPVSAAPRDYRPRFEKLRSGRARLLSDAERMRGYDRWDRFDVVTNDPNLWYVELTGRRPCGLLPETRGWYDRNPEVAVCRDPDALDAASAIDAAIGDDSGAGFGDVS